MLDAIAAFAQALSYWGIALGAGAVLARATLAPDRHVLGAFERLRRQGAWLTIGATLLALAILVLRLGDALDASILSAVLMSNVGGAAGLRLSAAALLLVTPESEDDGFGRGMQLSAAGLMLASFVFSGHAATEGLGIGMLAALHVAVVAWWLAALIVIRTTCTAANMNVVPLVQRFSKLAVRAIVALIVAGGVLIATLIDFSPFELTGYARNLAIKLVLVALVLALAAYNKFVLTSRVLACDATARARLRRSIDIELALIGIVLLATAMMTTYTSPHE